MYFDSIGPALTEATVKIAVQAAKEKHISHIVVASNTGATAIALAEEAQRQNYNGKPICISQVYGFAKKGENALSGEMREQLVKQGVCVHIAAHVLSGAERSISNKFQGAYPVEIIAHSLRMFSQGTKVCVEISTMALDAGLIPFGKPVIALGGTTSGADTALLLTPSYASSIFETKIHEILCKPR